MASFVEDLWASIFTPGPTPTLLIATNVTFASLQVLLFALLLATHSIHFVVLSFLSAALWWSINWFAQEVRQAQEAEKERQSNKERAEGTGYAGDTEKTTAVRDSSESETETEGVSLKKDSSARTTATPGELQPSSERGQPRKRLSVSGDSSGYGSTDSEWEKVDNSSVS